MTVLYITAGKGDAPDPNVSQPTLPEEEESEESEGRVFLYKTGSDTPNICKKTYTYLIFGVYYFQTLKPVRKGRRVRKRETVTQSWIRVISTGKYV